MKLEKMYHWKNIASAPTSVFADGLQEAVMSLNPEGVVQGEEMTMRSKCKKTKEMSDKITRKLPFISVKAAPPV